MIQIIPTILVNSEKDFIHQIKAVQDTVDLVQLDIADGKFVSNKTWADPIVVEKYSKIDVELHLMVKDPLQELTRWSATEQIKRVLIHYESVENFVDILPTLRAYGWEIGIVLNPETPTEVLTPYLSEIQSVMFMGINPGLQGQELIPEVLEKIKIFSSINPEIFTEIDGAVNDQTLPDIIATGVKAVCPGSAIFKQGNAEENIKKMEKIINSLTE